MHKHKHMLFRVGWLLKGLVNMIIYRQLATHLSHLRVSCLSLDDFFFPLSSVFSVSVAGYNLGQGDRYVNTTVSRRKMISNYFQLSKVALISYFSSLVRFSIPITSKSIVI